MNNIKHGRVMVALATNRTIRVLLKLDFSCRGVILHISADVEFAERKIEGLNVSGALR